MECGTKAHSLEARLLAVSQSSYLCIIGLCGLWLRFHYSHEILPSSPPEKEITLHCSAYEYCLAQPIVAQYEIFFQKAAHLQWKESSYDDFTITA